MDGQRGETNVEALSLLIQGTGAVRPMPLLASVEGTGPSFIPRKSAPLSAIALMGAFLFSPGSIEAGTSDGTAYWRTTTTVRPASELRQRRQAPRTTAELLTETKAILGLSVTQLSVVLQVTRQIVYKWLGERSVSVLQDKNRERLDRIYAFAHEWKLRSSRPIGKEGVGMRVVGNKSLFDLLSAETIKESQVKEAMATLAARLDEKYGSTISSSANKPAPREGLAAYSRIVATFSEDDDT